MKKLLSFTLLVCMTIGLNATGIISVFDNTLDDWELIPNKYLSSVSCGSHAKYGGLKSMKVCSDSKYLNILLEVDSKVIANNNLLPLDIFINTDNSTTTGYDHYMWNDMYADILIEGYLKIDGSIVNYNPDVFTYTGKADHLSWDWEPLIKNFNSTQQLNNVSLGNSQKVGDFFEIVIDRDKIPVNWNDTQISLAVSLSNENWGEIGALPDVDCDESGVCTTHNPLSIMVCSPIIRSNIIYVLSSDATAKVMHPTNYNLSGAIVIPDTINEFGFSFTVTEIGKSAFSGCSGLTSITIGNSVTSIGEEAFRGCSGLTSIVVESGNPTYDSRNNCNAIIETATNTLIAGCKKTIIPNSVTSIGDYAFWGCSGLTSITIPNSVTSIGDYAFYNCSGLADIYCYAATPPSCVSYATFEGVSEHCYVHVPVGTKRAYELAIGWSHFIHFFEISEISGETSGEVNVEVTENTAVFSWPVNPTASSYTLVIKKNNEVFCTLTFNSLGQLVGMAFAPSSSRNQQSSAESTTYGYSFVVSNLAASSTYDYVFTAKDNTDQVLSTKSGRFTTKGYTDLLTLPYEGKDGIGSKFIQNGQLYILRDGKTYTVQGVEIK